ncbi:MAG: PAS domain S-box protein [Ignavibacteriaceae bacterium]
MATVHKINSKFFNSLKENIKIPFLVLNHSGDILFLNDEASLLLSLTQKNNNIFNTLEESSSRKISSLIEETYVSGKPLTEEILINLSNGNSFSVQITVSSYKDENELFVFCSLKPFDIKLGITGKTMIKSKIEDLKELINNEKIFELIIELRSLYPLTYMGREKLLTELDKAEDLFWIKNFDGNFALANRSLANFIGLSSNQLEGKPVKSFIPSFLNNFLETIEDYIRETFNFVSIEGVSLFGISASSGYNTIIIPLIDADKKVIAFIGVIQKVKQILTSQPQSLLQTSEINIFEGINKPISLIDNEGIIKHDSKEFCKLFSEEIKDLRNLKIDQVFPIFISSRIQKFMNSTLDAEIFEITENIKLGEDNTNKYFLELSKIFDQKGKFIGASIFIESAKLEDDLETIIKSRGRMFDILINKNPEPILIYETENLRFIEVNHSALAFYGYRRDEFLQMDLTDLYTPEDIQTLLGSSDVSNITGKYTGPFKHRKKDGSFAIVMISKIPFRFKDKDAHYNIIKDVTSELELGKTNLLYKSAFDNTEDIVILTDANGFITFINSSAENNLGYSKKDLENTSFTSLAKDDERGMVNGSVFQSQIKEPVKMNFEIKKSDGSFLSTELFATPIMDYKGEIDSFTILAKVEREMIGHSKESINDIIPEYNLGKDFSNGNLIPETISTSFLSNLFHEILTPINVILGFVQELKESIKDLSPEQKESVEFINQNKERLLTTMNSMVEFASIGRENNRINLQSISITEIIDQLQDDIKDVLKTKGIEFAYGKISSSLKFESDKQKFQMLISLMGRISSQIIQEKRLYFSSYQIDEENFVITFRDSYANTSKHLIDNLYGLFQLDNHSLAKDYGISKITSQLANSLLKLLKGKFEIFESAPDKNNYGFIFPVSLSQTIDDTIDDKAINNKSEEFPEKNKGKSNKERNNEIFNIDIEPAEEENIERVMPLSDPKILNEDHSKNLSNRIDISSLSCLYIEDQVDSQILFKVQMKELKEIKFAVSFEEALPLLDENHFDFVVMDINLQGEYNGLDALKIIHKMPNYKNIPIIAVTAYVLPGDKEKFIATGFNDFISKPIFRERMMESLEKIFLMHV